MPASRTSDQVGRVVGGRYRLLSLLGAGSSGQVYLAEDVSERRRVAVKMLHAGLARDEPFLRRFRAEAQAASVLDHRHIVKVFDWGEDPDGPWLVMEHMGGGSLRDLLDDGLLLTLAQATALGARAAGALAYAHGRGIVHRDLTAGNILFDQESRPAIADFGLARALAEGAVTEPIGSVLGTARYASPEQAEGRVLDGRSDVYSLGLVMVEAVSGQVPFVADTTIGTLMARVGARWDASPEMGMLGPVVEEALAPERDDRPDAAGMSAALTRAARKLPVPGPVVPLSPPSWLEPPARDWDGAEPAETAQQGPDVAPAVARRRRRWWPPLVAAMLLVLAGLASYAIIGLQVLVPTRAVPSLRGDTVAAGRARLSTERLGLSVAGRRYDAAVPAGRIASQEPAAKATLHQGSSVEVVVSRGPRPVAVPNLANMGEVASISELARVGLKASTSQAYSETVPKGTVVSWSPAGGVHLPGTTVTVVISQGPAPRTLPNVVGESPAAATSTLQALGLAVSQQQAFSPTVPAGQVSGTSPTVGQSAARGQTVVLYVSKGPDLVSVPAVKGESVTAAAAALGQAGFNVSNVFGPPTGTVFTSNPPPGSSVPRGSSVNLYTQ